MKNWFFPTRQNNYRAKLITNPSLIAMAVAVFLMNQLVFPAPAAAAKNDINPSNLLAAHNIERRKFDLAPLKVSTKLSISATKKAKAMLQADCWSHYCPEGKSPWEFFADADYTYLVAGENLAEGFYNIEAVMNAWMNSPTHRENILRKEYEEVGFGMVTGDFQGKPGNIVVAVHFATPKPSEVNQLFGTNDGDLAKPEILKPTNGQFFSNNSVSISGLAREASLIELFLENELWQQVSADNGIFTYNTTLKEGNYSLSARGRVGARQSGRTPRIAFAIDKTANVITASQTTPLYIQNENVFISVLSKDLEAMYVVVGNTKIDFSSVETDVWTAGIRIRDLREASTIQFATRDKAGNEWTGGVEVRDLVSALPSLQVITPQEQGRILGLDFKAQFNILAIVMLISLFGIDFLALTHSGLTKYSQHSKSQLHIGILLIILIASLTGALSGKILEGINFIK